MLIFYCLKRTFTKLRYSIMVVFMLVLGNVLYAQVAVQGKVTDNTNQPLVGVSILEKGTSNGTTTNATGNFSLNVATQKSVLLISYVGYPVQEITVGDRTNLSITLTATAGQLNEVVVTGYGTQKRREVTSAITTISAENFNKGNISDVAQLLQGKAAGLSISRPGGDPNAGFVIRLRGLSTIGSNTSPLIVLDGQIGADINTVDPNDIQSIDILKDGSAAAIYGSRGSQGVIIITTKKGRAGASQVSYNGSVSTETPVTFSQHMN